MRALVYHGPGRKAWEAVPDPELTGRFVTHRFDLAGFGEAYDVFARSADTGALKVVLSRPKE